MRTLVLWLVVASLALCTRAADDPIAALATTIAARLAVIEEVARYKWNARLPAYDPSREAALLAKTLSDAAALGLEPERARAIVEASLAASRTLQTTAFERWERAAQPPFEHVRDLDRELRVELDALTQRLLRETRDAGDVLDQCGHRAAFVKPPEIASEIWSIAIAPLLPKNCVD